MSDDDGGSILNELCKRVMDDAFRLTVDLAGSFVKNQNFRI